MSNEIRMMPDEDGFHWRGVRPEDEALVNEIMLAGVPGSPGGFNTKPHDGTLGGFCHEALKRGHERVIVSDE